MAQQAESGDAVRIGDIVRDARLRRVGVVMDYAAGRLHLRPPGGGLEWECLPKHVVTLEYEQP